jgi:hypothetical protein
MRDSKEFGEEEIGTLEQVTQTADGVRLIAKVLEKAKLMDAGKFSNVRTEIAGGESISNAELIRLYEAAYALQRTDPEKSRVEVAKLGEYRSKM